MNEQQKTYVVLASIAGLVYTCAAWGLDAIRLTTAHASMPWLKFAIALLPVVALFTLVGWLSSRVTHLVVRLLLWIALATGLSYLIGLFSFQYNASILRSIHPQISASIDYITPAGISSRRFVIIIMTNILLIVGGLLFENASQSYFSASGTVGRFLPILLCLAFFAGAGYVADSNFNTELREQLVSVDQQLQEVADLDMANLSDRDQRMVRRFTKLNVDLQGPRKLVIGNFDDSFSQVEMLIDFNGTWVKCLTINGYVGNCEIAE
ncbi:MAG: hypothetical protein PWQ55_809 [Chloroflexota bacterium]|nr:hypothetical protein [Chloroflexota bacterium]